MGEHIIKMMMIRAKKLSKGDHAVVELVT